MLVKRRYVWGRRGRANRRRTHFIGFVMVEISKLAILFVDYVFDVRCEEALC